MAHTFTASNPESLRAIGNALYDNTTASTLEESVQMTKLLLSLAGSTLLDYPLRIYHTPLGTAPDYKIQSATRQMAVELTQITNQNIGHAKAIHHPHVKRVMMPSRLIGERDKRLPKSEVMKAAFCMPAFDYSPNLKEQCEIWKKTTLSTIERKSVKRAKATFQHGDEDWLVLLDGFPLLANPWLQDNTLLPWLREQLLPYWQTNWFSKVFIQSDEYDRTWMICKKRILEIA